VLMSRTKVTSILNSFHGLHSLAWIFLGDPLLNELNGPLMMEHIRDEIRSAKVS
jgi:hypothetical protein